MKSSKRKISQKKKARTLKQFTFDADNSNTGPAGIVISVEAYSKKQATRLANAYLSTFAEPIELPVPSGFNGLGVRYAMCCVAPNLSSKDIDLGDIREVAVRDQSPNS